MKIQGRFIAVLAVLGLLIALLPLAPAGAVTGTVKLTGGEEGQYFSDQTGDNIITIEVTDADLTPTRIGTARTTDGAAIGGGTALDLSEFVIAGEKDRTDMFNGGTTNGPCKEADLEAADTDGDGTIETGEFPAGSLDALDGSTPPEDPTPANDLKNIVHDRCPDTQGDDTMHYGEAIVVETTTGEEVAGYDQIGDGATEIDADSGNSVVYRFTLQGIARDKQSGTADGVGVNGISDIVSVVVNGRTATAATATTTAVGGSTAAAAAPGGTVPWYSVHSVEPGDTTTTAPALPDATPGGGTTHVYVRRVAPQSVGNSVVVTYRESEFNFNFPPGDGESATPLTFEGTNVRFGGTTYGNASSRAQLSTTDDATVTTTAAVNSYTIVTFAYNVVDSKEGLVTLNTGNAGERKLAASEIDAESSTFQTKVAIFSVDDYSKINTEAGRMPETPTANNPTNDTDGSGKIEVDELNANQGLSSTTAASSTRSLAARVTAAAAALGFDGASAEADEFLKKVIQARHGDIINVVYVDANPSVSISKTATVDLEAPVVTLIAPSNKFFTNTSTVTFSVDVVDTGAGVPDSSDEDAPVITVQAGTVGVSLGTLIRTPIVDGYRLTVNPEGSISEGKKEWFAGVRDKVGNEPVMDNLATEDVNEAPRGAAGRTANPAGNPFEFTVDTRAPELFTGITGVSLKNPGVTTGVEKGREAEDPNSRDWVKVEFNTHEGKAPLDASTVSAGDFRVDGLVPLDAKINARKHGETAAGVAVYLQVGQLDTDDRPEVQLTGEIKDKAGNIRTQGRLSAIADGLNPILEVTPSTNLAEKEISVTIISSETLRSNPMLETTETKPVKDTGLTDAKTQSVSLVTGSLTQWTATIKNVNGKASRQYVVVTGTDLSNNSAKIGDATNEDDFVTFQLDDSPPTVKFRDANGNDLEDTKQTEGAVWIVAQFDEDEHGVLNSKGIRESTDKSRGVTVTALTLTNLADDSVVTTDASGVFDSEADCVDHEVTGNVTLDGAGTSTEATATETNKCAERTLAVNLAPGSYNIKVTGVDAIGNEVSGNTDFTVIESAPFKLDLRPGVNFISIPGMPMADGGNINMLLGSHPVTTVSTYDRSMELQGQNPWLRATKDAETGMFSGDITTIEPGKAYFITATASSTVEVKLQQAVVELPPTITVRQGFNAIGFWSPSGAVSAEIDDYLNSIGWTVAYSYDPTPGRGWETIRRGETDKDGIGKLIEQGKGYLVYATYDAVLTP